MRGCGESTSTDAAGRASFVGLARILALVIELACIAVGAAAVLLWQRGLGRKLPPPQVKPAPELMAEVANELANLLSGAEGRAHHLIEQAPDRQQLPAAAEGLLRALARLRGLHRKLLAHIGPGVGPRQNVRLDELIPGLADDLQHLQLGLELHWNAGQDLPAAAVCAASAREALLYLVEALLRTEPGASRLTIDGRLDLDGKQPQVALQMVLEWVAEPTSTRRPASGSPGLARTAATNLLIASGGNLQWLHRPGHAATAVVLLPTTELVAAPAPTPAPPPAAPVLPIAEPATPLVNLPPTRHAYGGSILLESDPALRAMVAAELKSTGRAVFACADGAAACTLLAATPERFELMLLDSIERLTNDPALAEAVRKLQPVLKLCVLAQGLGPAANHRPSMDWPQLRRIQKPFGVHELRQALASVLADG